MPYKEPSVSTEEEENEFMPGLEYMQSPMNLSPYRSDENAFLKQFTEVQYPEEIDEETRKKWVHRIMFSRKEKGTAFMENPNTTKLNSIMLLNMKLMEMLGCENLIWSTVFDNIDIMKTTQGQHGNLIKQLTVKRQEFADKTEQRNKKFFEKAGDYFKTNEEPEHKGY